MLHGVLITNAFLLTEKFQEHYTWLLEAAERQGMSLELKTNTDFFLPFGEMTEKNRYDPGGENSPDHCRKVFQCGAYDIKKYDFILYWDKDISLGRRISMFAKEFSIPVFNSIEAIELCDDKVATYDRISAWNQTVSAEERIPLIPTVMAPMTYSNVGYTDISFVSGVIGHLGLPLVIK